MSNYRPPVSDFAFVLEHVVGYPEVAAYPGYEHADLETVVGLLHDAGDFVATAIAPSNHAGDVEGAHHSPDGSVTTPAPFPEAYRRYVDAGWGSVPFPEEFGGGGFPWTVGLAIQEMLASSNMAFALCPLLTQGAIDALLHYGSDEQKATYLPKMISGEWSGTMNLTEPQAGSDVGALTTRAVPLDDGTFAISGQKIFITFGEHDLTKQIVHLVLARTPGAPEGTKGISCFIVPKFLVNEDGSLGDRNGVKCLSIEHKLGIHGSPTCVMEYDEATGYLIGEENLGMRIMFVMMNSARLSVGTQGLALSERAYQDARDYALERHQGLAIGATGMDSAIVEFPDVRRMLLTQKAYIAAMRRMMLLNSVQMDTSTHAPDEQTRARAAEIVGILTPICKSFGTDLGNELTSLALQVFGGMGFIEETGVAQYYRDVRITAIYEGTNGIQAADLVGRKLGVRDGASVLEFLASVREIDAELAAAGDEYESIRSELTIGLDALQSATEWMLRTGLKNPNAILSGSSPYLRMWGLVLGGWLMARSALAAPAAEDREVADTQLVLARFYAEQLLPQTAGLLSAATAGADDLFALTPQQLSVSDWLHGSVSQEIVVAAPVGLVWSAFAELDFRERWFSLPGERSSRSHELDFRVGGEEITRSTFNNMEKVEVLELRTRFLDLVPERRITVSSTFTLNGILRIASVATTELEPVDDGTRVSYLEQYQCFGLVGGGSGDSERGEREGGTRFMLRRLTIALDEAQQPA